MTTTSMTGGCFCGAIRWEIGNVFDAGYCHCSICRRISGSPVASFATVKSEDFRLTRGAPKSFASSAKFKRLFCADCGSAVYGIEDGWPFVSIGIGTFDDPTKIRPTMHQCAADRLVWFDIADDLPRFPTNNDIPHPRERRSPIHF